MVVGGDRKPPQQVRPIRWPRRCLVGHEAFLHEQAGDVAEVRDDYADQAAGHLVEIQGGADLAEGVVKQRVPHHRWVEEPSRAGGRYAHDRQRRTAIVAIDGLDRDHRVDRIAALGPERQYGRGFPARPRGIEQARQRSRRTAHHQVTQKGSQQSAAWRVERVPRSQVMPNYPSGRIDPQNQRPHGGRGGKRSYIPHTTGLPQPVPAVCDVRWRVVLASAGAIKTIPSTAARLAWRLRASRRRHSIAVADRVIQVAPRGVDRDDRGEHVAFSLLSFAGGRPRRASAGSCGAWRGWLPRWSSGRP